MTHIAKMNRRHISREKTKWFSKGVRYIGLKYSASIIFANLLEKEGQLYANK